MKDANSIAQNRIFTLGYFVAILISYSLFSIIQNSYLDALIIPIIFGFIWLGLVKQRFSLAVAFAAIFVIVGTWLIKLGYMTPQLITSLVIALVISSVGQGVHTLSWKKSTAIVGFVFFECIIILFFRVVR